MAFDILGSADRQELQDAYVERFRKGEIGPLVFRSLCEQIGLRKDEIDALRNLHIDECAKNIRNGI